MVGRQYKSVRAPIAALTLAMMLVFAFDLFVPFPIGASILYVPLVLVASRLGSSTLTRIYCAAAIVLILVAMVAVPRWPVDQPLHFAMLRTAVAVTCLIVGELVVSLWPSRAAGHSTAGGSFQSEREFRDLAENLPDVVARFDRQLRHLYINRAVQRTTGMRAETFLGKSHTDLNMPPDLVEHWQSKIRAAFDTGQSQLMETSYPGPGGTLYFECRLIPELAADGSVETVLAINRDITETVRAQEQAQAHLHQLAHVSRLSTIGSFASEISHEINQPLHAIVNYAQACTKELEKIPNGRKSNLSEWIQQISEQASRAAEIIRHSNRFARKGTVQRTRVDVNQLIHECLQLKNFNLRSEHIQLHCELAPSLPPLMADSIQIQQVLVNLLRNAIEAMSEIDEADRRLVVRSEFSNGSVQISVRDSGIGISDEQAARLFEPFFTTKDEGMGMGLAVSQAIVEAHHGRLWAEPNPDRGVTFHLSLPLRREELSHEHCCV